MAIDTCSIPIIFLACSNRHPRCWLELFGYPGITDQESRLIQQKLQRLTYLSLTRPIEQQTIKLRQTHKIKLPDAIIAATAMAHGLDLLTLDQKLSSIISTTLNS